MRKEIKGMFFVFVVYLLGEAFKRYGVNEKLGVGCSNVVRGSGVDVCNYVWEKVSVGRK